MSEPRVPTMQEALDVIAGLAVVAKEHRERRDKFESESQNGWPSEAMVAGTDRTILISQLDYIATAVHELRHSPHLWASAVAGLAIEEEAASLDALDVELLARAMRASYGEEGWRLVMMSEDGGVVTPPLPSDFIDAIATEYASLAAKLREAGEG